MFTALLDTNVLWPNMRRNFLLALAVEGAYRPLWSEVILDELEEHETEKLVKRGADRGDAEARAARLVALMREEFSDAMVTGWEPLESTYDLPDPDDEHVVAAAHIGGAGTIVTENLKDFPDDKVPATITVQPPDKFAFTTASMHPGAALRAAESIVTFSGTGGLPKRSLEEVLAQLRNVYSMGDTVDIIEKARQQG